MAFVFPVYLTLFFGLDGWLPEHKSPDDHEYTFEADIPATPIDLKTEYPSRWGPPYDQYELESCVANAAAALHSFEWKKHAEKVNEQSSPAINPSRLFIWFNARYTVNKAPEQLARNLPCCTRDAMKSLNQDGVCKESLCPYPETSETHDAYVKADKAQKATGQIDTTLLKKLVDDAAEKYSKQPCVDAVANARDYRITRYKRLDIKKSKEEKPLVKEAEKDHFGIVLQRRVCGAISEAHPVQLGFRFYEPLLDQFEKACLLEGVTGHECGLNIWNHPSEEFCTPILRLKKLEGKHKLPARFNGRHAVLAIGCDSKNVLCLSSWGAEWSRNGTFLMPWEWITDFEATSDFWIIDFENGDE